MRLDIHYGQGSMNLQLDETRIIGVVSPKDTPADQDSVAKSISQPTAFMRLESFLEDRKKILVVVNDHTRATPTPAVLRTLTLKGKEVTTLVATGTHRSPNSQELIRILGDAAPPYGGGVAIHDSRDASLRSLGHTSRGTQLSFNSHLFEADGIITISSVEPHYFAGFTGGRKFLLPALAGFKSVEMNHSLALDPRATVLCLDGNPVHEDFMNALLLFDRNDDIFSIQLVLNSKQQISYASAGHIVNSFIEAAERARQTYATPVKAMAEIVIAVARPPLDLDLYQSQKAIENVQATLRDEGILILVSRCTDGIGNRSFYDLLASGDNALRKAIEEKRFGCHKAMKIAEVLRRASVFAVTSLPARILEAISITPFNDVQSALNKATNLLGRDSRVLIVDDAGVAVPFLEGTRSGL